MNDKFSVLVMMVMVVLAVLRIVRRRAVRRSTSAGDLLNLLIAHFTHRKILSYATWQLKRVERVSTSASVGTIHAEPWLSFDYSNLYLVGNPLALAVKK